MSMMMMVLIMMMLMMIPMVAQINFAVPKNLPIQASSMKCTLERCLAEVGVVVTMMIKMVM
eukprot:12408912-Karenia_brevis.AAC.1